MCIEQHWNQHVVVASNKYGLIIINEWEHKTKNQLDDDDDDEMGWRERMSVL